MITTICKDSVYIFYVSLQRYILYHTWGTLNKDFNLGLEHNTNILAYLTTKVEEQSILSDLSDLFIAI